MVSAWAGVARRVANSSSNDRLGTDIAASRSSAAEVTSFLMRFSNQANFPLSGHFLRTQAKNQDPDQEAASFHMIQV
jgi:hypothetical protein